MCKENNDGELGFQKQLQKNPKYQRLKCKNELLSSLYEKSRSGSRLYAYEKKYNKPSSD